MVRRPKSADLSCNGMLTESELEIMRTLWQRAPCSIREVHEILSRERNLAYTTVATFLKILEQKGAVVAEKSERAITYRPLLTREAYEERGLLHLARNVFSGDAGAVVTRLIDKEVLSAETLRTIRALIESKLGSEG